MTTALYKEELAMELDAILRYWMQYTIDRKDGGFFGQVDEADEVRPGAPKGVVLNSRILWTFSAAFRHTRSLPYRAVAHRAYEYLLTHFLDREYGGVYWSVDAAGAVDNGRQQIYGLAFSLYGLSEFHRATGDHNALEEAISLFRLIEKYSYDPVRKGYYEAFTRDWAPLEDLRLSPRDANERKTMNTHLHVLEAYANLYRVWPNPLLRDRIGGLLQVFEKYIIEPQTGHLILFFEEDWTAKSGIVSYGHDIEAAWLLQEAAETAGDKEWIQKTRQWAITIAGAAAEGLDSDGGLWYERDGDHLVREKHWWPQAEAMVGFLNAWQVSGEEKWLQRSLASWTFVQRYIKDHAHGEWYWGIREDHSPMPGQDKAGFWKCPYHNGRACMEIMSRLEK